MHSASAGSQRNVQAIIDDDPGIGTLGSLDASTDQRYQRAIIQTRLAYLHQIYSGTCRLLDLPHEAVDRPIPADPETRPVGDETDERTMRKVHG